MLDVEALESFFFVIKSLEAMYHVYLYEIQEVDFKLKYGGIQDYSLFVIENISNIYYVNSFAGIQKLKKTKCDL